MAILGCDVSKYNPRCDFKKAKANGLNFTIIRAGSGANGGYEDPKWVTHYKDAKAAGVHVGAYWYCYALNTTQAIAEADKFLKSLDGMQFEYPVYLDLEDPTQAKLSKSKLTDIAVTFLDRVEKKGYYVGLYTMGSWFQSKLDLNRLKNYDFWVAHWGRKDRPTYVKHGMWQFTNKFTHPGIAKAGTECDGNYSYVNYPEIIKKHGLNNFKAKGNQTIKEEKQTQKTSEIQSIFEGSKGKEQKKSAPDAKEIEKAKNEVKKIILEYTDGSKKEFQ